MGRLHIDLPDDLIEALAAEAEALGCTAEELATDIVAGHFAPQPRPYPDLMDRMHTAATMEFGGDAEELLLGDWFDDLEKAAGNGNGAGDLEFEDRIRAAVDHDLQVMQEYWDSLESGDFELDEELKAAVERDVERWWAQFTDEDDVELDEELRAAIEEERKRLRERWDDDPF